MSEPRNLDDYKDIYPGFFAQREELRDYVANNLAAVTTANDIFQLACDELRRTGSFVGKTDEEVARQAMRVVLKWMKKQNRN